MKIVFIDNNTGETLGEAFPDLTHGEHHIPRKGEPVYVGGHAKKIVKYARWRYVNTISNGKYCELDSVEVVFE
jgi:hypothetical protein